MGELMALFANKGGNVPTQPGTAAPLLSPRPVARGQVQPPPFFGDFGGVDPFKRGQGGILPERGSQQQLDLVKMLVASGMQQAQGSGSPLLALLAPLVGGAVSARTQGLYDGQIDDPNSQALETIMGGMPAGGPTNAAAGAMAAGSGTRDLLAKTLMAEAGGEGYQGMLAAGAVIANRARAGGYGKGIDGVIMKPGQFSAWNGVTGYAGGQGGLNMANIRPSKDAYRAADAILSGNYQSPVGNATHYYNPADADPKWGMRAGGNWQRIGNHVFGYGDEAGRGPANVTGGGSAAPAFDRQRASDLMEIMSNPRVSPQVRSMAGSQLQRMMAGQEQPKPERGIRVGDNVVDPVTGRVIYQGPQKPEKPAERRIVTGADGYKYYEDDGQRVLPDVQKTERASSSADTDRQVNIAISTLNSRVDEMLNQIDPATGDFYTREGAIEATKTDPLLKRLWRIIDQASVEDMVAPEPQATPTIPSDPATPNLGSGNMARPASPEDYAALPSGTQFIDPEGNVRVKP